MRIAIVGNSGSGKSTLARRIATAQNAAARSIASLDLDTVAWEPGKIAVARAPEAAAADVTAFCSTHDRWIVEGCYGTLVGHTVAYSPILLFVDPGVEPCLNNCRNRPWEPHKYASKAEQDERLEFLLSWVRGYYTRVDDRSLRAHQTLFESYRGLKLRLAHHQTRWLDDLAARFQGCAVPAKEWTHAAHLVVGLWHVHRYGSAEALARLRNGIRRLNESHGGVNSTTNGYHETITAAYVQLLAQYLDVCRTDMALDMRALDLLAGPLTARDVLFTFYSRDRLMSTTARLEWLEPDLAPLDLSEAMGRSAPAL
jgi:adenylate kinase family enzyme